MKSAFVLSCLLGLFCFSIHAQEEEKREPSKAAGRVAWFIYTSMPEGLENPVKVMSGKDIREITLSKRSPSEPVKIPADGIIRIVREVKNPEDPAKPKILTLAQATIAEGLTKALLILVPFDKPKGDLLFQTKVQDLASFNGGDYLYLNLTTLNIAVEMGKTPLALKPGDSKIHNASGLTEPTNVPIRYSYFNPSEKQWKVISASTVVLQSTRREICIFNWDAQFGRIDYHGVTFPVTQ